MFSHTTLVSILRGGRLAAVALGLIAGASCTNPFEANDGDVELRVANESSVPFDRVEVRFPGQDLDFGGVPAGTTTDYQLAPGAYRYGYIEVEYNGKVYTLQPIDYVGEERLSGGRYTFALDLLEPQFVILRFRED
jgi:hypothetical protein